MKKRIGILAAAAIMLLCVRAPGEESLPVMAGGFVTETLIEGFSVPMPADPEAFRVERKSGHYLTCRSTDKAAPNSVYMDAYLFDPLDEFAEKRNVAEKIYNARRAGAKEQYEEETIRILGHIARICVFRETTGEGACSAGILHYARNNRLLQIRLYSEPQNGTAWEDLPKITLDGMKALAEQVSYDPAQASVTAADGEIRLSGPEVLSAGQKIKLTASFIHPEKAEENAKGNTFTWSVAGTASGDAADSVTVGKNGELSAGKQAGGVSQVTVTAESSVFHTTAEFTVTVVPAMRKLSAEPAQILMYTGETTPVTVRTAADPDTVPLLGIAWSAAKPDTVEITPGSGDGTAEIRPLKAGETSITAREPGGKEARISVTVLTPVKDIELSVSGRAVPYGSVTVRANPVPKDAGNRKLTWSLDVGPDIATVDKGKVTIGGRAKPGTVITVTCTAPGAPEPVVRSVRIEVEKK